VDAIGHRDVRAQGVADFEPTGPIPREKPAERGYERAADEDLRVDDIFHHKLEAVARVCETGLQAALIVVHVSGVVVRIHRRTVADADAVELAEAQVERAVVPLRGKGDRARNARPVGRLVPVLAPQDTVVVGLPIRDAQPERAREHDRESPATETLFEQQQDEAVFVDHAEADVRPRVERGTLVLDLSGPGFRAS
jgi:hypothetical protein